MGGASEGKFQGAYHVDAWSSTDKSFRYTILYNGTVEPGYGAADGDKERAVGALAARMYASLYRQLVGTDVLEYEMDYPSTTYSYEPSWLLGLSFIFAAVLGFMQVIISFQIVAEKVTNMRELMTMACLSRVPFWTITWIYYFGLYFVQILFFFVVCYLLNLRAITTHSFGVTFVVFLLYATAQVSYACWISTLFSHKWAALIANFFLFVFVFWLLGWQLSERAPATAPPPLDPSSPTCYPPLPSPTPPRYSPTPGWGMRRPRAASRSPSPTSAPTARPHLR